MSAESEQPRKKRTLRTIIFGALGLLVLCVVIVLVIPGGNEDPDTSPTPQPVAAGPTTAPEPTVEPMPAPTDAPTAEPTPEPTGVPATMPGVGDRVESGGIALTITEVTTSMGADFFKPDTGNVYLVASVLIENVTRDETPYNPMYFGVKDSEAFEYKSTLWSPDPGLKSGNLPKGDKVRGNVAFEVPEGATGFVLTYEPIVILGGYEPIRINLGD